MAWCWSFAAAKAPLDEEVEAFLGLIRGRVFRLLVRRGLLSNESDEGLDEQEAPPLHALDAASVRQRVAMGRRPGATVLRLGDPPTAKPAPPERSAATPPRWFRPSRQRLRPRPEEARRAKETLDDLLRSIVDWFADA